LWEEASLRILRYAWLKILQKKLYLKLKNMEKLKIITSTVREGRKGRIIADWITAVAKESGHFEAELLDIAEIDLPLMTEPNHPRLQKYKYEYTKKWSASIAAADAFIIVLSEYNFSFPAPIKNAIDYLFHEWRNKPVGFVSYGGMSGGMRAAQAFKQVVTALNMMPLSESVAITAFTDHINEQQKFVATESLDKAAKTMLRELEKWSTALKVLR
jgi:NAD(P)H-dependent FMN reductase